MIKTAAVTPANGRDYRSKAALLKDWEEGKDFMLHYLGRVQRFSSRDVDSLKNEGFTGLQFRYSNQRNTFIFNF
jgi:hypothetical protein